MVFPTALEEGAEVPHLDNQKTKGSRTCRLPFSHDDPDQVLEPENPTSAPRRVLGLSEICDLHAPNAGELGFPAEPTESAMMSADVIVQKQEACHELPPVTT